MTRRRSRGWISGLVAVAALAALAVTFVAPAFSRPALRPCENARATPATATVPELQAAVTCLLQNERSRLGVGSVASDDALEAAGAGHAADMVAAGYFAHSSPAGQSIIARLDAADWIPAQGRWDAGEILAWGTGAGSTPAAFVAKWLKSSTHFAVLKDPSFTEMGVGLAAGTPGGDPSGLTASVEFGRR